MRQLHMFNSFLVYSNNLPFSGDHFTGLTMVIAEPNAVEAWLFDASSFRDLYMSDDSSSSEDEDDPPRQRQKRKHKSVYSVADRTTSLFYEKYLSEQAVENGIKDEGSFLGKKFRRRFRVPYCLFEDICRDIMMEGFYRHGKSDASGSEAVQIELLVLGSLRIMGSGCTFDAIEELTNVSEETHRVFFHNKFCAWGDRVFPQHVHQPKTEEEIKNVLALYERIGLPGCGGSVDCVHLVWDKCMAGAASACTGKEGFPTLAFEVSSDHTKRILSCSQYFWGSINDKTISLMDPVFDAFRKPDGMYTNYSWTTSYFDDNNNNNTSNTNDSNTSSRLSKLKLRKPLFKKHTGLYLICDGGYHKWPCMMNPYHVQIPGSKEERWSTCVESARKDVECVFGILKKRFLILKHPIRIHDPCRIERIFRTCCVLHNLLLDFDGFTDWNWSEEDVSVEHTVLEESARLRAVAKKANVTAGARSAHRSEYDIENDDEGDMAEAMENVEGGEAADNDDYQTRRLDLMAHHQKMFATRSIKRK